MDRAPRRRPGKGGRCSLAFPLNRMGLVFGFLIWRFIHSSSRSYYLFLYYLFLLLEW